MHILALDKLAVLFTVFMGVVLAWPFLRWPADPHFGTFTFWALTRRPGETLPDQYIVNNQGFTRIFINHLMLLLFKAVGRKDFLFKARLFQAVVIALTGGGLYLLCRQILHFSYTASMAGALLFLFMSTRPQFDFMRLNAEPLYNFVLLLTLAGWMGSGSNATGYTAMGFCTFLLTFAAINCKIVYLGQVGLVGLALLLDRGWPWPMFWAMVLGGVCGGVLFRLLFRYRLGRSATRNLLHYARWAARFMTWDNYRFLYRSYFSRTPLAQLALLSLAGCICGVSGPNGLTLSALAFSGLFLVLGQCRIALYHIHTLLVPWCITAAVALDRLQGLHHALPAAILIFLIISSRGAFMDLPGFYRQRPLHEHLFAALGPTYIGYYDTRVEEILAFHQKHSGPFLPWGIMPQLYSLSGQRPLLGQLAFFREAHAGLPENQAIMVKTLMTTPPPWIYDPTFNNRGVDGFNPLSLYQATGLVYVPIRRAHSVVYYALKSRCEFWSPQLAYDFYIRQSATLDLFHQELEMAGINPKTLPKACSLDILDLVSGLALGFHIQDIDLKTIRLLCGNKNQTGRFPIRHLFAAALFARIGERERARTLLTEWNVPANPILRMSAAAAAALWGICRYLEMPAQWIIDHETLNKIPLCQTLDLARFLDAISSETSCLYSKIKDIEEILENVRLEEGDYVDRETMQDLRHFMAERKQTEYYAKWSPEEPVIVLRMAPMRMLAEFLDGFNEARPAISLVVQEGSRTQASGLHSFAEILTISDGPFCLNDSLNRIGPLLGKRQFAKGVLIIHSTQAANLNQIMELAAIPKVGKWYACTDSSLISKRVVRLQS